MIPKAATWDRGAGFPRRMNRSSITRRAFAQSFIALTAFALASFATFAAAESPAPKPDGNPAETNKPSSGQVHGERVLFIGNSYTGVNNLPKIYQDIVGSTSAVAPEVSASTPGGKTLEQHLSEGKTLQLVDQGNWDVVVLQGQSQEAAMSEKFDNMRASFLKGAKGLCARIKAASPSAKIVFYQTWARHPDYWNNPRADLKVGKDSREMQSWIQKWYRQAATENQGTVVAPVGDAWQLNYLNAQAMRLHTKDNSHPAWSGSYLAGLVLYGTIHPSAKLNVPFHGKLPDAEAAHLQGIASQALQPAR